jgi:hypothetical protein
VAVHQLSVHTVLLLGITGWSSQCCAHLVVCCWFIHVESNQA